MSYVYKIDVRTTPDGIKSWLEWNGDALRAYAEKIADDGMTKFTRMDHVPDIHAIRTFIPAKDRVYTSPETFARKRVEDKVRKDYNEFAAASERKVVGNGGW